jgi:DNA-directed RNA polymerase alpha subunit
MDPKLEEIINRSIASLDLSDTFKQTMWKEGFHTLNDIMSLPLRQLVNMKWFTKEMLEELAEFMFHSQNDTS